MPDPLADLRFALRRWTTRRTFAITAILTLALGIGAATAIFSVVNGVLLRPLPWNAPDRLVAVWVARPEWRTHAALASDWDRGELSWPMFQDYRRSAALSKQLPRMPEVVGIGRPDTGDGAVTAADGSGRPNARGADAGTNRARGQQWAALMQRTFGFDVLACPRCGGRLRPVSLIEAAAVIDRILRHLGLRVEILSPGRPVRHPVAGRTATPTAGANGPSHHDS
jgi:hypothetical protein